jgi:hypothetical protein
MSVSIDIDFQRGGKLQLHITASAETAQGAINSAYEELQRAAKALNCTLVTAAYPPVLSPSFLSMTTPNPATYTRGTFNDTVICGSFTNTASFLATLPKEWGTFKSTGTSTELAEPLKQYVASHWLSNSVSCTDGVYAIIATDIETLRLIDTESGKLLYCAASATLFDRIQEVAEYIENSPDLKDEAEPCSNPFDAEWYSLVDWSAS